MLKAIVAHVEPKPSNNRNLKRGGLWGAIGAAVIVVGDVVRRFLT